MIEEVDPIKAINYIRDNAPAYAKAKAERIYIENALKSVKATLMADSDATSLGAKEIEAYSHPNYKLQLEGLREAVEIEERLRWLLLGAQMKVEVYKTQEYARRQELRNLNVP